MQKNTAGQKIGAQMVNASDGSAFTGAVTVYVTGDAGTQAVGSVGAGACTHEGNGYHTYAPAQAETNYTLIAFTFIGSGAVPATVQVFTWGFDTTAAQVPANVTQWSGTNVATPDTAGYPKVTIKDGTGTGELDTAAGAVILTATERDNIADALLKRDWTSVTGEASRSVLNALRFLRNKWSIISGTLTVTKEDDTTSAWTGAVTTNPSDPVDSIDPS